MRRVTPVLVLVPIAAALHVAAAARPPPACAVGCVHLQTWGRLDTGDGRAIWPLFLWADSKGSVRVADYDNDRVQRFTSDGVFMSPFGSSGSGADEFTQPTGICCDEANQVLHVADSGNARALHGARALPERWVVGLPGRTRADDDGEVQRIVRAARERGGG